MTVQEHYEKLEGELPGKTKVNAIDPRTIEVDLGDEMSMDKLDILPEIIDTLKEKGYTVNGEPIVTTGYRGAMEEALLLRVPIEKIKDY